MEESKKIVVASFANQKGGVGKSTLTVIAANALADKGYKVRLLDADFQGSLLVLRKNDERTAAEDESINFKYEVSYCSPDQIGEALDKAEDDGIDVVFIDMPGQAYGEGISNLLIPLDLAFIPVKTGDTDISSSIDFINIIKKTSEIRVENSYPATKYFVVINEAEENTARFKSLVEFLKEYDYPFASELVVKKKVAIKDWTNTYRSVAKEKGGEELLPFLEKIEEVIKSVN